MSAWNAFLPESSVTLCRSFRYLLEPSPQRSLPASPRLKGMCMHVFTHTHTHHSIPLYFLPLDLSLPYIMCVRVAQSCLTVCDPMDCSPPGSPVHGDSPDKNTDGLPFPSPGDLSNSGIEHGSPALQADSSPSEPPGKHLTLIIYLFLIFCLLS